MRFLEIWTVGLLLFTIVGLYFDPRTRRPWMNFLPLATSALLLCAVVFEKFRWQMAPVAGLVILIFLLNIGTTLRSLGFNKTPGRKINKYLRIFSATLGGVLFVVSVTPLVLFPVFRLPRPTGPFQVGTTYLNPHHFNSPGMEEKPDQGDVYAQVWYPAEGKPDKRKPYWRNAREKSRLFGQFSQIPGFLLSHLKLVKSHSHFEADFDESDRSFPVLIYSPGYRMLTDLNSVLMEELASYGFVVFGIAHPHDTPFIDSGQSSIKVFGENPEVENEIDEKFISKIMRELCETHDQGEKEKIYQQMMRRFPKTCACLQTRVNDLTEFLKRLEELTLRRGFFYKKLDLDRIGILGFSLGGAAAVLACIEDPRFTAGVSIDGFLLGNLFDNEINFPSLLITSEQTALIKENRIIDCFDETFASHAAAVSYRVAIKRTNHLNLTDFSLFGPFAKRTGMLGGIKGRDCLVILNDYIRLFCDRFVKREAESADFEGLPDKYPDSRMRMSVEKIP